MSKNTKHNDALKIENNQPQVRLKGSGRTRKYGFCTTPELEADLEFIRNWYGDKMSGRSVSPAVVVRRSLVILADHLRNLQPGDESDRELITLLMLAGSRGKSSIV
jgi:hypothetical protein